MGVYGLETYVKNHNILCESTLKRGSEVVIDGSALLRVLNNKLPQHSIRFGGEYETYTKECTRFLNTLLSMSIKVCIVFDGGSWSSKKGDYMFKQHSRRLRMFHRITIGGTPWQANQLLPAFAQKCLIDVVEKINKKAADAQHKIEIVMASYEADHEVARRARDRQCPALTTDSDMMIFDLPAGYIPLETLKWEGHTGGELRCKCFKRSNLSLQLKITENKIPLFAALSKAKELNMRRLAERDDGDCGPIYQLICKCLEESDLKRSVETLSRQTKTSINISDIRKTYDLFTLKQRDGDHNIPEHVKKLMKGGKLYCGALTVCQQGHFIPMRQAEDFNRSSSNDVSRSIRRIWYSIICAGQQKRVTELSRYPRKVLIQEVPVDLMSEIQLYDGTKINLSRQEQLDEADKREVFIHAIDVENKDCELELWQNGDETFEIPTRVTTFWLSKSNLKESTKRDLVHCLTQRQGRNGEDDEIKSDIFDIDIAHAYAEWQSCLLAAYDLNILLGQPLPDFKISDVLINGSRLHQSYNVIKQTNRRKYQLEKYYLHFWYGIPVDMD